MTSSNGSPAPYSSYSIVMPVDVAAVMPANARPWGAPPVSAATTVAADMSMFRRNDARMRREMDRVQTEITRLSQTVARYDADRRPDRPTPPPTPTPPPGAGARPWTSLRCPSSTTCARGSTPWPPSSRRSTPASRRCPPSSPTSSASWAATSTPSPSGPPAAVDEGSLEEVRDTQVRLANEQARYQIAFRADLARLAEHLQRTRP